MPGCSAIDCSNRSEQGYVMKAFPRDPELRATWTDKVKRVNWKPTNYSFLCEVHFDSDQWEKRNEGEKKKLKRNAVPTLFTFSSKKGKRKAPYEREPPASYCEGLNSATRNEDEEINANEEISKLKKCLLEANNTIDKQKEEIKNLRVTIKRLYNENYRIQSKLNSNKQDLKIFNSDQVTALERKDMSFMKWSDKTVETALAIKFSCGTKGYEVLLNNKLPFPSIRTLQRRLQNLKFEPGISKDILNFLKIKVKNFEEPEKECVLLLDEMSLKEGIDYDTSTKSYIGNVTLNDADKANQSLVFMIGGISTRWKQAVGYFLTNGKTEGITLKNLILDVIQNVEEVGLRVNSVTSDMGAMNRAMWKAFGIQCGRFCVPKTWIKHPCDPNRTLEFLADVPHLLKNIRTSLLSNKYFIVPDKIQSKYNLPTNIINPNHLQTLVNFQKGMDLKLAPKITEQHLKENHFDKMKVSRAKHVLSHDVSSALKFISNDTSNKNIQTTAWFIEIIDKWFTLMTSRNLVNAVSKINISKYEETVSFLKEIIYLFENIKVVNKNSKITWKPIQTGVIISTSSILRLQDKFLNSLNFKFLLTSRFTQDALENLFSVIRMKQPQPTALQFKNNLKIISVAQYLKPNTNSSYDDDDGQFLPNFLELLKENPKIHKIILPFSWDKTNQLELNLPEQNCLYNISGYIVSRVIQCEKVCDDCIASVGSKEHNSQNYAKLVNLREYKKNCLFYVNNDTFQYFLRSEIIFRSLEVYLLNETSNCKSLVSEAINSDPAINTFTFLPCHNIKNKLHNRFVIFRLKIFGLKRSKLNLENKKITNPSVSFSSKSMR